MIPLEKGRDRGTERTDLAQSIVLGRGQLPIWSNPEQGRACVVEGKSSWEGRGVQRPSPGPVLHPPGKPCSHITPPGPVTPPLAIPFDVF